MRAKHLDPKQIERSVPWDAPHNNFTSSTCKSRVFISYDMQRHFTHISTKEDSRLPGPWAGGQRTWWAA